MKNAFFPKNASHLASKCLFSPKICVFLPKMLVFSNDKQNIEKQKSKF
jgi:hypothetical protein